MAPKKSPGSPKRQQQSDKPAPADFEFEFFGPHVPGLLLLLLPAVLYGLIYGCNSAGCLRIDLTRPPYIHLPSQGEQPRQGSCLEAAFEAAFMHAWRNTPGCLSDTQLPVKKAVR